MAARLLRAGRLQSVARHSSGSVAPAGSRWPSQEPSAASLLYGINRTDPQVDARARRRGHASSDTWLGSAQQGDLEAAPRSRDLSLPADIPSICAAALPGWRHLAGEGIHVEPLPGTSNRNFKVHLASPAAQGAGALDTVLFRVYGAGLELLYDHELQVQIARMLSSRGVAAQIHAQGPGWRIEQWWHNAAPLPNARMKEPAIMAQVAAHIARFHQISSSRSDFPARITALPPASISRLETWGRACQQAALEAPQLQASIALREILAERGWVADFVREGDDRIAGAGLDVVFSHWDTQENNILLVPDGLQLIDFEYSGMDYQSIDLATYFIECAIDLDVQDPPYYKVNLADMPTEDEMRFFCAAYLSEYLAAPIQPSDPRAVVLARRAERFTLALHLLWAMWSVVRACRASSESFDYLNYGRARWSLYKRAKRALLDKL